MRERVQIARVCEISSCMLIIRDDLMTMTMLRRGSSGLQCSEVLRKRQRNASATYFLGSEVQPQSAKRASQPALGLSGPGSQPARDSEVLTKNESRSHFGSSGCLRRCCSACLLLGGAPPRKDELGQTLFSGSPAFLLKILKLQGFSAHRPKSKRVMRPPS